MRYSSNVKKVHKRSSLFSIFTVANKNRIPRAMSFVKAIAASEENLVRFGVINANPNQPAARLINSPESARSQGLVKDICINLTISGVKLLVNS